MNRVSTRYNYKDLVSDGLAFSEVEITDAGTDAFYFTDLHALLAEGFSLNTLADGTGTNITGYELSELNEKLTELYGKNVYEKITITDATYQTGTIYATGFYSGDVNFAEYYNALQAQIDALASGTSDALIGSKHWFDFSEDLTAYGLYQYAFDNAISTANYPALWNKIGHLYNAQHVSAGDTDLSASTTLFYPTPIPGAYDRVGIPDIEFTSTEVTNAISPLLSIDNPITGKYRTATPVKIVRVSGILPTGLAEDTEYWLRESGNYFIIGTSEAGAIGGLNVDFVQYTDAGTAFVGRLTQEGIVLDDAFQGHYHGQFLNRDGIGFQAGATLLGRTAVAGTDDISATNIAGEATSDGTNGTQRTTNETRPKTNYSFGYIKVEHITSAGEPISALREVVSFSIPSNNSTTIVTHSQTLGLLQTLNIKAWYNDGTSLWKIIEDVYVAGSNERGFSINNNTLETSESQFNFLTPLSGLNYYGVTGGITSISSGTIELVVTKPNLINTVFDVSSLPHEPYDISASNEVITLPTITGALQTKSIYWTGGDGTDTLSLTTTETVDPPTVGGELASIWIGEGEGHMLLESDGSNWQVREYEDYLNIADSGNDSNRIVTKEKNGIMTISGNHSSLSTLPNVILGHYRSAGQLIVFGATFISTNYIFNVESKTLDVLFATGFGTQLTTGATIVYLTNSSTTATTLISGWKAIGRWRT